MINSASDEGMHKDPSSVMGKGAHNNTQLTELVVAASRYEIYMLRKIEFLHGRVSDQGPEPWLKIIQHGESCLLFVWLSISLTLYLLPLFSLSLCMSLPLSASFCLRIRPTISFPLPLSDPSFRRLSGFHPSPSLYPSIFFSVSVRMTSFSNIVPLPSPSLFLPLYLYVSEVCCLALSSRISLVLLH